MLNLFLGCVYLMRKALRLKEQMHMQVFSLSLSLSHMYSEVKAILIQSSLKLPLNTLLE